MLTTPHPSTVLPRQSQSLGKRTPTPSQRKHHHRPRRQQARPRQRTAGQTRHTHLRRRAVRPRSRSPLLRDQRQDRREREGAVHGDSEEVAAGPGGAAEHEAGCQ